MARYIGDLSMMVDLARLMPCCSGLSVFIPLVLCRSLFNLVSSADKPTSTVGRADQFILEWREFELLIFTVSVSKSQTKGRVANMNELLNKKKIVKGVSSK